MNGNTLLIVSNLTKALAETWQVFTILNLMTLVDWLVSALSPIYQSTNFCVNLRVS